MRSRKFRTTLIALLMCWLQAGHALSATGPQTFRADEWVTECDASRGAGGLDRSITVPFWESHGAPQGSFTLVVMLQTGNIGIVGRPFPIRAVLRVDNNPPIECGQPRNCAFPSAQPFSAQATQNQVARPDRRLYGKRGQFSFSMTPKGFQAELAQIRGWGYRTE